jgi:malate permease and related proteins
MDLFLTTFQSIAVLLGVGLIGFWIIRKRLIPEKALGLLSPLALEIALPCLIFSNILTSFSPQTTPDWWMFPVWWLVFTALAAILTGKFMFISHKTSRREFAITLFFQNGLFIPLAILAGMFPADPSYLVYLFLFMLFFPTLLFNGYHLFFKKQNNTLNWKKIFHPIFIVTIIAMSIRLFNIQTYVPDIVLMVTQMVGAMSIPLVMIILGANIYSDFQKKGKIFKLEIIKFVALKNILFPLIFLGVLLVFRPEYHIALIIILQSAVPPVTAVPLLVERAGGNQTIVNQFMLVSFLCSLITIPVMISLFGFLFSP